MMAPRLEEIFYICLCIGLACTQSSTTPPAQSTTMESKSLTTVATSSSITQAPSVASTTNSTEVPHITPANSTGLPNATTTNSTGLPNATTTNSTGLPNATTTNSTGLSNATTTNSTGLPNATTTNSTGLPNATTTNSTGVPTVTTAAPLNGSESMTTVADNTVVTLNGTGTPKTVDSQASIATSTSLLTQSPNASTVGTSTAIVNSTGHHTLDPGLIALIVILVAILLIGLLVTAVKYSQQGKPEFKRLQELPMNSLSEDAPFAQYPPK
ncbi:mucin-5AC-like [Chiloscyllium plagiosum]|uniref:mucin-5AC-like n=1 Tax=Chiloscyllium plagiosum TaxID=36176 RepID=UPI001CB87C1A|nr:mucin-5AC-like [Chiloscyllium plagiosum]